MLRNRTMVSYAQNGEDVILDRVFRDVEKGFYVDVGAHDPSASSVTRHFYLHGWRGINVEPTTLCERFTKERPEDINLAVAVSNRKGMCQFHEFPNAPGLSSLGGDILPELAHLAEGRVVREVPTLTLCDLFGQYAPPEVTFLSVDVEGHEREVLTSNDWKRHRPRVVLVEATIPNTTTPCHHLWEDVLLDADYRYVYFDGLNRYYVRTEDADTLAERFSVPVNCFDDYRRADLVETERQLTEAHEFINRLHAQVGTLTDHRAALEACIADLTERLLASEQHACEQAVTLERLTARLGDIERGVGERTLKIGLAVARGLHRVMHLRSAAHAETESQ